MGRGQSKTCYFAVGAETLRLTSAAGDTVSHPGNYLLRFTNGVSEAVEASVSLVGSAPHLVERFVGA